MPPALNNVIRLSRLANIAKNPSNIKQTGRRTTTLHFDRTKTTSNDDTATDATTLFRQKLPKDIQARIGDDLGQPNGFKLFNVKEQYKIDVRYLQTEMHKLQNLLHPDRFIDQDITVAAESDRLSSMVNDFYRILTNPYERGKYLLGLVANKSETEIEETLDKLQLDSEFLAKMMDISEKIYCSSTDQRELSALEYDLESELARMIDELNEEFSKKNIDNIFRKLGTLKFVANCHKALADRQESFSKF